MTKSVYNQAALNEPPPTESAPERAGDANRIRFGLFELDISTGELRKGGVKVRLQEQPFRLLTILLDNGGQVVTREELRERLWPADTFVDFDNSLNTTASKLREALGDSATNPRFIETVPRRGYRFIGSAQFVEQEATAERDAATETEEQPNSGDEPAGRSAMRVHWGWLLALGAPLLFLAVMWALERQSAPEVPLRRFALRGVAAFDSQVISPDGRHVAYASGGSLWVQDLDQDNPREVVAGGVTSFLPKLAWSPDSRDLVYSGERELRRAPAAGGRSLPLHDFGASLTFGGLAWSPDGDRILFTPRRTGQSTGLADAVIYWIPSAGGNPKLLFENDDSNGKKYFSHIGFISTSDGKRLLLADRRDPGSKDREWSVVALDEQGRQVSVLAHGTNPVFSPTGHVLYDAADGSGLWAAPISVRTMEGVGEPFSVREGAYRASVAQDGTLLYADYGDTPPGDRLVWLDDQGARLGIAGSRQDRILYPEISPDGDRVAVAGADERKEHIWVHESAQPLKVRSTRTDAPFNRGPLWLGPTEIIFSAKRERKPFAVYLAAVDASADEKLIFEGDSQSEDIFASDISADGRLILYDFHPRDVPTVGVTDIGYLERQPDGRYIPKPFLSTVFGEKAGKLSPDGRWVAYVSDEPGQPEVYVCRFPQGDRKRRVSIRGGSGPRWSPDGKKLYYRQDSVLVETEVIPGPELEIGASRTLFESRMLNYSSSSYAHYDVAPEGNRFLVREGVESTMRIVQNWFAEFNR